MRLANNIVEFHFEPTTGSLQRIKDLRAGREILTEPTGARLFRLMIPTESWTSRYADSHEGGQPDLRLEADALTISYPDVLCQGKPTGIAVTVTVRLPADSAEAMFQLRLRNGGSVDVQEVRFPWVGGFQSLAGPGKDAITIASQQLNPHGLFPLANPHTFCRWRERLPFDYPSPLLLPYLDVSGGGNGVSYICYLPEARSGVLGLERLDPFGAHPSLSWSWASLPFVKPGHSWESPRVGIAVHDGDWHETARRFRAWVGGWWKDPNPPASLRNSIGLVNLSFTSFDGTVFYRFADLPRLARECVAAGLTHVCLWHRAGGLYCNKGDFNEIMDEPPEVLAELKQALAEAKGMGVNMSLILNFRLVRASMKPYRELGESEPLRHRDGSPSRESYPVSHYHLAGLGPGHEVGDGVVLCQRPDSLFAGRARKIITKMLDLGFTSIFIDQPLNGSCCFAANHRHAAPDVAPHDCVRWAGDVSHLTKARSAQAYVIGELPELFQTEQIDLWWYWQWRSLKPEVYRYSHPDSLQLWVIDGDVGELNRAFALGFYVNLTPAGMESGGIAARPAVARQCARLAALRQRTAPWTVDARFADHDGLTVEAPAGVCAAVFVGDDRVGIIVAETANQSARVKLVFDPSAHGRHYDRPGTLHTLDGNIASTAAPRGRTHELELDMPPQEVAVWTLGGQSS